MEAGTQRAADRGGTPQVPAFAAFYPRLAAYLLDLAVIAISFLIPGLIVRLFMSAVTWPPPPGGDLRSIWSSMGSGTKLPFVIGGLLATGPVYSALFHASPWQATFGKRRMNIHVTGNDGQRIGIWRSIGRSTAWCFCALSLSLSLVSGAMIVAARNRRGLHDLVAGTQVLTGRKEGVLEPWRIAVSAAIPAALTVYACLTRWLIAGRPS